MWQIENSILKINWNVQKADGKYSELSNNVIILFLFHAYTRSKKWIIIIPDWAVLSLLVIHSQTLLHHGKVLSLDQLFLACPYHPKNDW